MEKMTSPERVVAAFAHEAVDRVPMIILDGGAWVCEHAGVSYDQMYATGDLGAQIVVDAYDLLGSDTITCGLGSWMGWLHGVGCPVNMSKIGKPMEVEPCLADIVAEVPTLDPSTARASLEADEHVARMLEQTRNIKSIVGDRKLLITTLCAPFTAAGTMAGVSGYMKIARKTPEIVDPLVDYAVAACAAIADLMCENGCDIIAFCDPSASGDMISPKLFERLSAPALKKLRGAVTSAKIFFLHICGNTIMRIPTVNTLGVDGFSIDFR